MSKTNAKRDRSSIGLEILVLNDLHNRGGVSDRIYEAALKELEREYEEAEDNER